MTELLQAPSFEVAGNGTRSARTVVATVFSSHGNRFLIPGFWWPEDECPAGWLLDAMMFGLNLGIGHETGLLRLESDRNDDPVVPCVRTTMSSDRLLHGRGTVYMISGPVFDGIREDVAASGQAVADCPPGHLTDDADNPRSSTP